MCVRVCKKYVCVHIYVVIGVHNINSTQHVMQFEFPHFYTRSPSLSFLLSFSLSLSLPPPLFSLQAAALVNTHDDNRIKLLYEFLADACEVYSDVFPLM